MFHFLHINMVTFLISSSLPKIQHYCHQSHTHSFHPLITFLYSHLFPSHLLLLLLSTRPDLNVIHTPFHFSFISTSLIALLFFLIHDVVSVPEKADRNLFLSALWCTLNLPHSLTLLISPHFITCFVNHS